MSHLALQRKVHKLLTSRVRVDSAEMVQALRGLSDLFPADSGEDILINRRQLRSLLERHGVQSNKDLVESFTEVQGQLEGLDSAISELASSCASVTKRLQEAREGTAHLLSKTSVLQQQQEDLKRKEEITSTFLLRFQLTEAEQNALDGEEVNDEFFDALRRIGEIRTDCKGLLQNYHQRVGLDIMDSLAQRLEKGYEKLYRWVQQESRELQHHSEVRTSFARALRMLKAMPVYYKHCCQEISSTRRMLLIRRFLEALTLGGADGTPRPIEMSAHDPPRYVGDMCAWVHQAAASEMDFFSTVLCLSDSPEDCTEVPELVAEVMNGVSRPLKVRINQSLTTIRDAVVLYKLSNILDFYYQSIGALFKAKVAANTANTANATSNANTTSESNLPDVVLRELRLQASDSFFDLMEQEGRKLLSNPPSPPRDLAPPRSITQATDQLQQLLELTSASLTAFEAAAVEKMLAARLDPLMEAISKGASHMGPSERAVYMINVLEHLQSCLRKSKNSVCRARWEIISLQIQQNADSLIASQVAVVLQKCGLLEKVNKIRERDNAASLPGEKSKEKLADMAGFDTVSLSPVLQAFYSMSLSLSALPHCDRILNALIRRAARQSIALGLCNEYNFFYSSLNDQEGGGYSADLNMVLVHTPAHISTLLDVPSNTLASPGS